MSFVDCVQCSCGGAGKQHNVIMGVETVVRSIRPATGMGLLTEVHGQVLRLLYHGLQHLARDELDAVLGLLGDQPLQHLLFLAELA